MLGAILDRATFWPLPGWVASYRLEVPFQSFEVAGCEVWHLPGRSGGPTVLFCHGNAGNLRFPEARGDRFRALHAAGANLWAFDYRGYGNSPGRPSESGLYEDARNIHAFVRSRSDPSAPFIIFGRSLGGAVALYLATEVENPHKLILESTFTSIPDVVTSHLGRFMADFMSYQFDSRRRIRSLNCPLFYLHGTHDRVVPYRLGVELYGECNSPKEIVTVDGAGHNNLQRTAGRWYQEVLNDWLSR